MDKETLSNYGWIVICILVLSVMIALATPFGSYIKTAVENTTEGLFNVQQKAMGVAGLVVDDQKFEDNGVTEEKPAPIVCSATFSGYYDAAWNLIEDPVTLTWEELKLEENGTKYDYDASAITDTEIGKYAFQYCDLLTSITIPDSVTSIGLYAFCNCTSLTSITFSENSQLTIGNHAFSECTSLASITFGENSQIIEISDNAFSECTGLTSIELPLGSSSSKAMINIPMFDSVFRGCTNLTAVNINSTDDRIYSVDGIVYASKTLYYCPEGKTSVTIPTGITSIGGGMQISAFSNCKKLTNIEIPDSVKTIGYYAFSECTSLASITFSENSQLTKIDSSAFSGCTSLTSIKIPAGVTDISGSAFADSGIVTIDVEEANTVYCSIDGIVYSKDTKTLMNVGELWVFQKPISK